MRNNGMVFQNGGACLFIGEEWWAKFGTYTQIFGKEATCGCMN